MKKGLLQLRLVANSTGMVVVLAMAGLSNGSAAIAQSDSCYMVTSSGRVVSLDKLCGGNQKVPPSRTTVPSTTNTAGVYRATIKYRLGKTPVIDVTFNGNQTFEMVVDTGADGTLITRDMARALRLPVTGIGQFEMADGRVVALPLSQVQSISVNGAMVRNVEVAIAEKTDIGLLGHDFFENYDIKIKQNVVEFYKR